MTAAINNGIGYGLSFATDPFNALTPNCTTSNCDFGTYQTLAVGYICEDISGKIQSNSEYHYLPANRGLPAPLTLPISTGFVNSNTTFLYPDSNWFPRLNEVGPLISNTFIIGEYESESGTQTLPFAVECALFWQVETYTSNTTFGNWTEYPFNGPKMPWNWTDTSPENVTHYGQTNEVVMTPPACYVNGSRIGDYREAEVLDPIDHISECTFVVMPKAQHGLQNYLVSEANGLVGGTVEYTPCDTAGTCFNSTGTFALYLSELMVDSSPDMIVRDIDQYMFSNIALTMKETVRQMSRGYDILSADMGAYIMPAQGVQMDIPRFRVRWAVMTYPTFLIMACGLFALTVALRSREHIWKRSDLPLLFHGLSTQDRAEVGEMLEYADMRERAEQMDVKFEMTSEGFRFVGHPQA
jgi:hypothetical protein